MFQSNHLLKSLLIVAALALSCFAAGASVGNIDIFLRGDVSSWQAQDAYRFTRVANEDIYMLKLDRLSGQFKIADKDWSKINLGGYDHTGSGTAEVTAGDWPLVPVGANFKAANLHDVTVVVDLTRPAIPMLHIVQGDWEYTAPENPQPEEPDMPDDGSEPSGLFLSMKACGYKLKPEYEFHHQPGSAIHTLTIPFVYDCFSIVSGDGKKSLGPSLSQTVVISEFKDYPCVNGTGAFYTSGFTDVTLTLDMSDATHPVLSIGKDYAASRKWKEGYSEVYLEDFDGPDVNRGRWNVDTREAQWAGLLCQFTDRTENVCVENSNLVLTARREPWGDKQFTSGAVYSYRKLLFRYGKLDIRMKQPKTNNGLVAGLWLLGYHYAWPFCGEIDINEQGSRFMPDGSSDRTFWAAMYSENPFRSGDYRCYATVPVLDYSLQDGEYHLYTMYWDEERLAMYLDEDLYPDAEPYFIVSCRRTDESDGADMANYLHWPYFIYMHLGVQALGDGSPVQTADDVTALNAANGNQASMCVDYVRLSQKGIPEEMLICDEPSDAVCSDVRDVMAPEYGLEGEVWYDLLGCPIENPSKGLYIHIHNGRAEKVIVR